MVGLFAEEKPDGLRVQRHRVPHLHPDGLAPAEQRPVLHPGLHARRLHQQGLQWIADNTMRTVLLRHCPQLRPAMRDADNAFVPWVRAGG